MRRHCTHSTTSSTSPAAAPSRQAGDAECWLSRQRGQTRRCVLSQNGTVAEEFNNTQPGQLLAVTPVMRLSLNFFNPSSNPIWSHLIRRQRIFEDFAFLATAKIVSLPYRLLQDSFLNLDWEDLGANQHWYGNNPSRTKETRGHFQR